MVIIVCLWVSFNRTYLLTTIKTVFMRKALLKLILIAAGLGCFAQLHAQNVRGVVKDDKGEPLVGVSVIVKGTNIGAVTGLDGDYALQAPAPEKDVLVFSMIGMKDVQIPIGNKAVIDATLSDDQEFLDEVVVIGYAEVKRRDVMGAVSSVDNKALTAMPVNTVSEALAGKMAGVQVTSTEGDPDSEVKIRVRGGGSITQDSSPLYIVDGFPVESINDINASDIQSIDVLKDAFSTAIYGSRGANGVVLVTTKSGDKGKVTVSYNAYFGGKKMANKDAIRTMSVGEFVKTQYELAALNDNISGEYIPYFGSFSDIDQYQGLKGNDWVQQVFGNQGSVQNHNISVSGSGDKYKWTGSYSHLEDNAIMKRSSYARDNLAFKAQFKPVKQLTFDFNARYSNTRVYGAGANSLNDAGSTSSNGRLKHSVQYTPIPLSGTSSDSDLEEDYGDNAPPLLSVADNDSKRVRKNWTINGAVTWHIIDNLNLKVEGGYDDYSQEDNKFYGLTTYYVGNNATIKNQPATMYTNVFRRKFRSTNTINYNFADVFTDSRHRLDMLAGVEYILTKANTLSTTVEGFPTFFDSSMAWNFMASGTSQSSDNYYYADDKLLSFFGRVNYEYDRRYSISATVRSDGSSRFSKGKQWGIFPSVAVGWTISNEHWMRGASWIDNLKLRYSFGTAGNNNIPNGVSSMAFGAYTTTWVDGTGTYWSTNKVGGKTIMPNPDLTWETTQSHNIGLDFAFWRSRLTGSVELYSNTTKDLLIQFPTQGSGYDYQYRNMGSVRNRGVEVSLTARLVENKNFGLSIGGNISFNQNEVTDLGGLPSITAETMWASTEIGSDYIVKVGQPLGAMYGFRCDGMYTTSDFTYNGSSWVKNEGVVDATDVLGKNYFRPGAMKFKDKNGDGKINADDKEIIGYAQPKGLGGFNLSAYFYGFDIAANFNYVFGNQIYNANKIEFTSSRKYYRRNLLECMETGKRWTNIDWETGEIITDAAKLDQVNAGVTMWSPGIQKAAFSDWAVEDGSFLRLSSVTIGYTLPEMAWTKKIHLQKLRIYATGTNLFCLTKYSGYDPEVDTRRATPLTPGVDCSAYPKSIGLIGGINITF